MSDPRRIPINEQKYGGFMRRIPLQRIEGRLFVDDHVDLSGAIWVNCFFDGCIVELHGLHPMNLLHGCTFKNCQYRGSGWPDGVPNG